MSQELHLELSLETHRTARIRWGFTLLTLSLAWASVGCGSNDDIDRSAPKVSVYTVTGTLLINGQPGTGAWVTLSPDFEGVPTANGQVQADGSFKMEVFDQDIKSYTPPGDPVGDYNVLVRMPQDPALPLSPDRFGGAYADPRTFKKQVQIELGENKLPPIDLADVVPANQFQTPRDDD